MAFLATGKTAAASPKVEQRGTVHTYENSWAGGDVACRVCNSENVRKVDGELTASMPDLKGLNVPPLYVCQSILICLDCGFAELVIPAAKLQSFKSTSGS